MSDDNVKPIHGAVDLPENPLGLAPRRDGWCSHPNVMLDPHTRTITCVDTKCGAVLDPFNFLQMNATTIESAWRNYRHVTNQAKEIAERVHQLKKEEQRLRAMIKRLQEKTGAVLSVRGKETL